MRKITPLIAAVLLLAAGCGFRGPLYLPEEGPGEERSPQAAESTDAAEAEEEAGDKEEGQ